MRRTHTAPTNRAFLLIAVCAYVAIFALGFRSSAEDKVAAPDITGVWTLHGLIGPDGNVKEVDKTKGRSLKFISNGRWCVTHADPETGIVEHHHGGSYTLDGNKYAESTKYATKPLRSLLSRTFHFKVQVKGDTLTQEGTDNKFNEVWKRVTDDESL